MRARLGALVRPAGAEQGIRRATGLLVVLALLLGWLEGGFATSKWAPAAVVVLWVALASAWAGRRATPSRTTLVAIGAYALLCLWTLASVLWADTPGRALDAFGRTLLYGLVFGVALLPRWPRASLRILLGLIGFGAVVLAIATIVRVDASDTPSRFFIDGRLIAPTGYINATAGLWAIALFPLVHLAAGGARTPIVRVLALAGAGLLLQVALLSQSRGAILAIIVAAIVLVVLTSWRGPVLVVLGAVAAATAPIAHVLLDVRGAPTVAELGTRLDRATGHLALAVGLLAVAGVVWQVVLLRLPSRAHAELTRPRTGNVLAIALVVVALVGGVVKVGDPFSWGYDRVDEALNAGYDGVAPTGDRLTGSLGSNRGDMYRVALDAFRGSPLTGIGAEDFQPVYLEHRRSGESPKYAHSLELGILAGLGVVGALLAFVAFVVPLGTGLDRVRRTEDATRAGVAAALAAFVAWLAGASWDWTWEFPALSIIAFVLLAAASRATATDGLAPSPQLLQIRARARAHGLDVPDDRGAPLLPRDGLGAGVGVALVVLALAVSVLFAGLGWSSYLLRSGSSKAGTDPAAAARDLRRASQVDPLDSDALLSRAIVVRRTGDVAGWRSDLRSALDRSPKDWLAHLELGMADALSGRRAEALVTLREAVRLNPQQPIVAQVLTRVRNGQRVVPSEVEAGIASGLNARLRPTQ